MGDEAGRFYMLDDPTRLGKRWKPVLETLALLRDDVKQDGSALIFVLFPSRLQVYPRELLDIKASLDSIQTDKGQWDLNHPANVITEFCNESALKCFDLTPNLLREANASPSPLYIPHDTHWNVSGNLLAATYEAKGLLPYLCKSNE